jgi:4-nitrophenyl phosphatase
VKQYRLYIFDLDGTLYRGKEVLPHATEVVQKLRSGGAKIRCLTNNSGLTAKVQAEKLVQLGIPVEAHEVITSTMVAAHHMQKLGIDSVFAVGEPGMGLALEEAGVHCVNLNGDQLKPESSEKAGAVLAGICSGISYRWLTSAMRRIHSGAIFLAANRDTTYPIENDQFLPGSGATVGALVGCTGREPVLVGKPQPGGILQILEEIQVPASETLVIGDRYETDIVAALRAGCDHALVMTGAANQPVDGARCIDDLSQLLRDGP